MTEEKFSQGLQAYLRKHKFSNAKTADLWNSLDAAFSGNGLVPEVMATWTQQMGFPVVHVKREADKIILTQERFLADANFTFNATESPFGFVKIFYYLIVGKFCLKVILGIYRFGTRRRTT